jgi:3-phenylpropionate/trans-cinnamate dioxygenase ferredoxin reductase component
MATKRYKYVIIGAGLAGDSAAGAIREHDAQGSVLLIGNEEHLPYDRPPLSKQLWFGRKQVAEIFLHDRKHYETTGVELALGKRIVALDTREKLLIDTRGQSYAFEKLLLATGGTPRTLSIPGGAMPDVCYFRTLGDYRGLREAATKGKSAVVIGGGFIGSEMAAGLCANEVNVTMIFPAPSMGHRVFPESLAQAIQADYTRRGIRILAQSRPVEISRGNGRYVTRMGDGQSIESDLLVVGIGIAPATDLAATGGLRVADGIVVNEYLQTSHPDIYAAGDNACFPYAALGQAMRVEHWDNAMNQGKCAGHNMAGERQQYTHMPFFFSDLFEFGYEAVGDVNAALLTFADWQEENRTGVVYYLRDDRVRGVMLCNVWEKVEQARELIRKGEHRPPETLRGAIA